MTDSAEDRDLLAAEFVLGTLERHDARAVERMAESDQELAAAIAAWQERLAPLARLLAEQAPPRELWSRLEESTAPAVLQFPASRPRVITRAWRSTSLWRGATAGALAMAAAFAGIAFLRAPAEPGARPMFIAELAPTPQPGPAGSSAESPALAQTAASSSADHAGMQQNTAQQNTAQQNTAQNMAQQNMAQAAVGSAGLKAGGFQQSAATPAAAVPVAPGSTLERVQPTPSPAEAAGGSAGFVAASGPDGALTVKPIGAVRVPSGKELELWALPPGAARPQAVGVLAADGLRVAMPEIDRANTRLMVSVEPAGNAPGAGPTGRVLYSGTLAPLQ